MLIPVKIGKGLMFITSDARQFILANKVAYKDKKTGKAEDKYEGVHFYRSLADLFNDVLLMKVRASDAETLNELNLALTDARRDLTNLWDAEIDTTSSN